MKKQRINFFNQIKSFYELVWHGEYDFKSNHVSLYIFLLNQNNRTEWSKWFKLPRDTGMQGSCIGSKKTYYKVLSDLVSQKLILKEDGINEHKAPRISIIPLKRGESIPIPEYQKGDTRGTLPTPLHTPLPTPLPTPLHTPLGVREEDSKTEDSKTEDIRQQLNEVLVANPENMKKWWDEDE